MNFGPHHYVPVLKIKRGEKRALRSVRPAIQKKITPLLEIVERKDDKARTIAAHVETAFKGLADSVRSYERCFLDAREIADDGPAAAASVFRKASAAGIAFTPVTGLFRTADVDAAMSSRTHGLALRLTRDDFEAGGLEGNLERFMSRHALVPGEVDLIVDLGAVEDLVTEGVAALTEAFLGNVPDHGKWRTFTISACAFPLSMGGVDRNSSEVVERTEWIAWRDRLYARRESLPRIPTFSDCAIQHPRGVEGFDPRTMQVSASIRYAAADDWLLIKGESTRITPPTGQFPTLATQLVSGRFQHYFAGAEHCEGCGLAKSSADGFTRGLGSAEAWRRIGTIHHLTTVVQQLADLREP